jgi:hypothetical protein
LFLSIEAHSRAVIESPLTVSFETLLL